MSPAALPWLWIPIVLWAALAQTARNAAQRSLVAQAGTLGATLARFLYGLPFAAIWVAVRMRGRPPPHPFRRSRSHGPAGCWSAR